MKKVILTITILTLTILSAFAQTEAVTNEGRKAILSDDGTWKYIDTKSETRETTNNFDCSNYIMTEIDKVTGISSLTAKEILIVSNDGGNNGFSFYILKSYRGTIIFSIQVVGASNCIDDDDKMNVLFRDGTRIELTNDADFNCDANYTQYFGDIFGRMKELEMFRTKEVETIRIWTSNGYIEEDFNSEQSKQLIHTVDCLLNN
jgi:hypothetical protein